MKQLLIVLTLSMIGTLTRAQTLSPDIDSIADSAANKYFKGYPTAVGLIIGISDKGHRKYYGYGRLRLTEDIKPDSNSIFEIGSITKTFTSLLLAQAVVNGKASLDDPAQRYLPAGLKLNKDSKDITLAELSNHSSGLPRMMGNFTQAPGFDAQNPYRTYNKDLLLDYLHAEGPAAVPGSRYEYSNLGAATLGLALETIWQQPYSKLLSEKILSPFSMKRTSLSLPGTAEKNIADGHTIDGKPTPHWDFDCIAPAGAIKSTAHDMLNYLEAQIAGADKAIELSHQPTFTVNERTKVALAWHILVLPADGSIIWHNGGTGGFSTFGGFDAASGKAVIVMVNNGKLNAADAVAIDILKQLMHR